MCSEKFLNFHEGLSILDIHKLHIELSKAYGFFFFKWLTAYQVEKDDEDVAVSCRTISAVLLAITTECVS